MVCKTTRPDVALLVSTFERPKNLRRSLESIALQQRIQEGFEVVVTDDGSRDETADIVASFARSVDFPVRFTTHTHESFHLSRCRNEGVRASLAPYLLFLDGDCILPRDYVARHVARRQRGVVVAGTSCYLDRETSARITVSTVKSGECLLWIPAGERKRMAAKSLRAWVYSLLRHPTLPRLSGGNVALWREDYERVNGYDENFVGWGCEDRDLQLRLSRRGVRFVPSMSWTLTHHLWHPPHATFVRNSTGTDNLHYMQRKGRLTRCRNGLHKRSLDDCDVRVIGARAHGARGEAMLKGRFTRCVRRPEVEILFHPGSETFSGQADCNLLLVMDPEPPPTRLVRKAHLVVCPDPRRLETTAPRFGLDRFDDALNAIW